MQPSFYRFQAKARSRAGLSTRMAPICSSLKLRRHIIGTIHRRLKNLAGLFQKISSTWATRIRTGRSDFSCVLVSFQNGVLR